MEPATAILVGSAIAAGASTTNTALSMFGQRRPTSTTHQAKLQLKYDKMYADWSARNLPTANRAGMEAAGFNPILAINSGTGQNGNISVSGHQAYNEFGDHDLVGDAAKSFQIASALQQLDVQKAQEDLLKTQAGLNESKTVKTLDEVEHPKTLFGTINKGLHNAADFIFGPNSAERASLFRDLRRNFERKFSSFDTLGVKEIKPSSPRVEERMPKVGDILPEKYRHGKTVSNNGTEFWRVQGWNYITEKGTGRILDRFPVKTTHKHR